MNNKESILNKINKLVDKYNGVSKDNTISIVHDNVLKTKDLYVCLYDDDKVGLFRKKNYNNKNSLHYSDSDIYFGIDTDNVTGHLNHFLGIKMDCWYKSGEEMYCYKKSFFATCEINQCIHLENIRLDMYNDKIISDYQVDVVETNKIPEILKYAYNYFNLKGKTKVLK